jgi:hypothetical protein
MSTPAGLPAPTVPTEHVDALLAEVSADTTASATSPDSANPPQRTTPAVWPSSAKPPVSWRRYFPTVEAVGPAHGLLAVLDQAARHVGLPLVPGPVASDNRRYAAAGLAAVGIGAGMAGYHSPADIPERVEPTTLTAIARLVVAACWFADKAPFVSGHPAA